MAIKCNLSTLMGKNRFSIQDVCAKTGLSRSSISKLYHDKMKRMDYETLDKLCILFKCQVSDILEFYTEE